jgi:hypothetical protein
VVSNKDGSSAIDTSQPPPREEVLFTVTENEL